MCVVGCECVSLSTCSWSGAAGFRMPAAGETWGTGVSYCLCWVSEARYGWDPVYTPWGCVCIHRCICTGIYTHMHVPLVDCHLGQLERRKSIRSLVPFTLARVQCFLSVLLCGASSVYLSCGHVRV